MIIKNPVYEREYRAGSRSVRFALLLLVFNFIIGALTLMEMNILVESAKRNSIINYASFLEIFKMVISLELTMVILVSPAFVAGSISNERQSGTLELLLTTKLSPLSIVMGKFFSNFFSILLIMASSIPILSLLFLYGGIRASDILFLCLCMVTLAYWLVAIGIFVSSISKFSSIATALTYAIIIFSIFGTVILYYGGKNMYNTMGMVQESSPTALGWETVFLLFNPMLGFQVVLCGMSGQWDMDFFMLNISDITGTEMAGRLFISSIGFLLVFSTILLGLAVHHVEPDKKIWRRIWR